MGGIEVLERVRKLEPRIVERIGEIEQGRRVPRDLVDLLVEAGCFRLLVPPSHGGEGATLAETLAVFDELCCIDGSVGWIVMIGATAAPIMSVFPRATFEEIYGNGSDVLMGGTLAPKGRAEIVDGGFRVSGQAPFASGCQHCDWLVMQCIVTENGDVKANPNGGPELRVCLLPKDDVEIVDTWYVAGLKGTGSHDIRVDDVFVPAERAMHVFSATPSIDWTDYRIPVLSQLGLSLGACATGIARGALNEAIELATTKRPAFKPGQRVAEDPLARFELGRADTLLSAATALLQSRAEEAWERAESNAVWTEVDRVRMRAAAWQATQLAREVVEIAYTSGGGTSLYDASSLQRRLRDVHAVTQHAGLSRDVVTWLGGFLLGEPVPDARI